MTFIRSIWRVSRRTNKIIDCGDYCKVELYYPHSNFVCDYVLISKSDVKLVRQIYWRKTEHGYARGKNPFTKKDIFLHKYITHTTKDTVIDHINRNKLDCRRENMRIADSQINSLNRNAPCNSSTGYKGVTLDCRTGKFRAYVKVDRKQINLGLFDTAELAYQERNNYERCLMTIMTMKCKGV